MKKITPRSKNAAVLIPDGAAKDTKHRLSSFVDWLDRGRRAWYQPDLRAYRDALFSRGLAASSVAAHLATVRGRYADILSDNHTRDALYALTPATMDIDERKAIVDEFLARLANAVAPSAAPVKLIKRQDIADSAHLRLTATQASALMAAPDVSTLPGLRDTAVIAILLCTGIREAELVSLDARDLRQSLGGALALEVREGKGRKARLVPYGALEWVLAVTDHWIDAAGIARGAVFWSFYKGGRRRRGRLSVRAVQNILASYPIMIDGTLRRVRPHDCRRTYARRLYEAGVDVKAIQDNLGHADLRTTLGYIGKLDVSARQPPAIYDFDLSRLVGASLRACSPYDSLD